MAQRRFGVGKKGYLIRQRASCPQFGRLTGFAQILSLKYHRWPAC
jgi:hypothetical protein